MHDGAEKHTRSSDWLGRYKRNNLGHKDSSSQNASVVREMGNIAACFSPSLTLCHTATADDDVDGI
jgi:hypothetical protein